jgi:DEP domain-containing protein 5
MTTSRTESQQPPPGRRRSNTAHSVFRNPPVVSAPLKFDDAKVLNSWVHDPKESATVIFNQAYWPGVAEGDMLRVTGIHSENTSGFLFEVPKDDGCAKPQLQVHGNSCKLSSV